MGGGSQKQRIIVVVIGFGALIVIAMIVLTILSSAGRQSFDDSFRIIRLQRKMVQASEEAIKTSPNADTRSFAATMSAAITSDSKQLEDYLSKNNQAKQLKTLPVSDATIKEQLAKAASNNDFDTEYDSIVGELLTDYIAELKDSNADSKSATEKALLESSYQHIITLTQTAQATQ